MKDRIIGEGQLNRDAIETHKKCGLLPSELLQQRDEWKATAEINDRAHDKAVNELMEVKKQRDELLSDVEHLLIADKVDGFYEREGEMSHAINFLRERFNKIKKVKETL